MRISSFHIDGFGIFHDAGIGNLPPGMVILLGANESGKSTCLEFLRTMLFGYPTRKGGRQIWEPLNGGRAGGSLVLQIAGGEEIHLTRLAGKGGGSLSLFSASGQTLPREDLERIFAGITSEVYRSVYGFSLSELENFACLNAEGVRSALYSASFGPGINPPGMVLHGLASAQNVIFSPSGKKSRLHKMLDELDSLNQHLAELIEKSAAYDAKSLELGRVRQELAETREKRKSLEEERRLFERRQNAWRYFNELRLLQIRLEEMPLRAAKNFPDDGILRLRELQKDDLHLKRQIAEYAEKATAIEAQQQALAINRPLAEALPVLRRLAERKQGYREALLRIPGEEEALRRDESELEDSLTRLGPDWDCQRIRNTNRSLFAREDLEKQAREMAAATSAYQACIDGLKRANREVETIGREVSSARDALQSLPEPSAVLNGGERDELRQNMARLEECVRSLPLREQSLENTRAAFERSFDKLHFIVLESAENSASKSDSCEVERECALLDSLLARQEEGLELAGELRSRIKSSMELEQAHRQAEQDAESTRKKMEDLRERLRREAGPGREALEARSQALRSLRSLAANIATEKERLHELDNRIHAQKSPLVSKSLPLLIFGAMLFGAGAIILLAHWFAGITFYELAPNINIPINLWSGYLVLACGVGFLAGGLPRSGPEARQFAAEMAHLQNRRETCALHLAELGEHARAICEQSGFADADPITLDAAEMLLEREREQCFQEEQAVRELEDLKRLLAERKIRAQDLAREHQQVEQDAQLGRRQWHALMQTLHLATIPSPESAESFFARAENARLAYNAVSGAAIDIKRTEQEKHDLENRISSLPPIAEMMSDAPIDLSDAVGRLLESCREAESFREQRIRAAADLKNRETLLVRAETAQREAAGALETATRRVTQSRSDWNRGISTLGLGPDLNPETVREAFNCMEHCLQVESRLLGRKSSLVRTRQEVEAFEKPIGDFAREFGEEGAHDEEGAPDWILTLDSLLGRAEEMDAAIRTMSRLEIQLGREKDELRGLEAGASVVREQIAALLRDGEASSEEEFARLAQARDEEKELLKNAQAMRDALKLAAGREDMEAFLKGLETLDEGEIEARLHELDRDLTEIVEKEDTLAKNRASLEAEISAITHSDELANLRRQKAQLLGKMEEAARDWSVNALAGALVSDARSVFERERQPEIIGLASELFASITNGRWRGLSLSLEHSTLLALPDHGEPVAPEYLSRGSQEQIYLALRMAYIREHARSAQTLPIIMDDILVNFDPERARRAARAFASFVDDGQQLFYFTCQPETARMLAEASPGAASYLLENGKFAPLEA